MPVQDIVFLLDKRKHKSPECNTISMQLLSKITLNIYEGFDNLSHFSHFNVRVLSGKAPKYRPLLSAS